jgi:hypothetical protein
MKKAQRQPSQRPITPPISGDSTMVIPMTAPERPMRSAIAPAGSSKAAKQSR